MTDDAMTDDAMTDDAMTDEAMAMAEGVQTIMVTIENVSAGDDATPIAPGVWVVHEFDIGMFTLGSPDAGHGLEALAEDGDPSALAAFLPTAGGVHHTGVFNTPDGAAEPGPVLPGASYSFTAMVAPGLDFSLATMFVQSNDWVFATPGAGLDLFDADGNLITGDITAQLILVDAGTETDQVPGAGPDQAPRQGRPDTGAVDPNPDVRLVPDRSPTDYIKVTVTSG